MQLAMGKSIEAIAAETGRAPSTIVYWINKHRLPTQTRPGPRARARVDEPHLRSLVERGLSVREIAAAYGLSATSVRYWLNRYGLRTSPARYARRDAPKPATIVRECRVHGWTTFRRASRAGAYRCARCSTARVSLQRRRMKAILLAESGGACQRCGYDRYPGALQFHHLDPREKRFQIGGRGVTRSLAVLREEARKCVLLCANCHAEVEAGVATLPSLDVDDPG